MIKALMLGAYFPAAAQSELLFPRLGSNSGLPSLGKTGGQTPGEPLPPSTPLSSLQHVITSTVACQDGSPRRQNNSAQEI